MRASSGPGCPRPRASRAGSPSTPRPGQSPELPGPAELLASAFAACLLKNVERFAGILPFHHEGAAVHVTAERESNPPRFARIHYELRVLTDEDPVRVDLLHRNLRKHGTVYNTLAAVCDITGDLVAEPIAGASVLTRPADREGAASA